MSAETIPHLILNSPYEKPTAYWRYEPEYKKFKKQPGQQPAGHLKTTPGHTEPVEDPGVFKELDLANQIRKRVGDWHRAGYSGVTDMTKRLFDYWNNPEERGGMQLFFCQLEAAETLSWLAEIDNQQTGIAIPEEKRGQTRRKK